jgi:hypothetical protein
MPSLNPSNSVTLTGYTPSQVEVGTYLNFTLTNTYVQGIIDSKDSHPDVPYTGPSSAVTYSGSGSVDSSTGVVSHTATTSNTWNVDLDYYATGGSYYTSRGNEGHDFDNVHLHTGTTSDSGSITGYYKYFYFTSGGTMPSDSATIRSTPVQKPGRTDDVYTYYAADQPLQTQSGQYTWYYDVETGKTYTGFYFEGDVKTFSIFNMDTSSTINATTTYPVVINDANGDAVNYTRYEVSIGGVGFTNWQTFRVIINL